MSRKRGDTLLLSLLGLAVICLVAATSPHLGDAMLPFWSSCCHIMDMLLHLGIGFWLSSSAQLLIVAVYFVALGAGIRRVWHTRRFVASLNTSITDSTGRLANLCRALGLSQQVVVLHTSVPLAFCFGLLKPRICVSTGLVDALTDAELKAVLLHEDYHRCRYDPLRTLLAELLATLFFFLPVVAEWRNGLLTSAELAADKHAVRLAGKPALAGALHKLLSCASTASLSAVADIRGSSATGERIAYLLDDRPPASPFSARSLLTSSIGVLLACFVLQLALS